MLALMGDGGFFINFLGSGSLRFMPLISERRLLGICGTISLFLERSQNLLYCWQSQVAATQSCYWLCGFTDSFSRYSPVSALCPALCVSCLQHEERLGLDVSSIVQSNRFWGNTSLCSVRLPFGSWRRDGVVLALGMLIVLYALPMSLDRKSQRLG